MSLSIEGIDFSKIKELDLHPELYKSVLKKNSGVFTVKDGFYLYFYSANNIEGAKHSCKIERAYRYYNDAFHVMPQNEKSRYFSRPSIGNGVILPIDNLKTKTVFIGHVPYPKMGSGFTEHWKEVKGVWTIVSSRQTWIS
tara:strand:- start:245 stop:664 length:420 start_codon:yes stop_codon:yes gene_type:complete